MTNSLQKRIGNAARKARVALNMTQEDAAEQVGVSVEFYSRIERGTALPSLKTFITMAVVFEVSTDRLLGLDEDEQAQRILKEFAAKRPKDPPELRRLFRKLRNTRRNRVRFVNLVLHELDKMMDEPEDGSPRRKRSKKKRRKNASDDDKAHENDDAESDESESDDIEHDLSSDDEADESDESDDD